MMYKIYTAEKCEENGGFMSEYKRCLVQFNELCYFISYLMESHQDIVQSMEKNPSVHISFIRKKLSKLWHEFTDAAEKAMALEETTDRQFEHILKMVERLGFMMGSYHDHLRNHAEDIFDEYLDVMEDLRGAVRR